MSSEQRKPMSKEFFLDVILEWKQFWMNQNQNSKEDHDNYFRRALGVDANMKHSLADRLAKACAKKGSES